MAALDASATAHSPALRTLLLLDLCDSTQLVERMGDQRAAELFRRHDRLVRSLLAEQHGREIDKTDGFLLLFERPVQAIGFALQYQRRLREFAQDTGAAMAARIGIHVGDVMVWDNSAEDIAQGAKPVEVEGLAKPVAARMMGLALPGQILLSKVAADLARRGMSELGELAARAQLIDHGLYRFKGVDEAQAVIEVGEAGVAPLQAPPGGGKAQRARPWWRTPIALTAEAVIAIALLVGVGWVVFKPESGIAFEARDWVVVADLANLTSDTGLSESMDLAFRQGLSQSQFVNVVSREQRRDALKRMRLDPGSIRVDRGIAVDLAQREQARAVLLPTLSQGPADYRFSVEVVDPESAVTVWSTQARASSTEAILPAIDEVISELRARLGESLADIEANSRPLVKVTTANLEALRALSIGRQRYDELKYGEALQLYTRATELDPEFAMAYAGQATVLLPMGNRAAGFQALQRANELSGRLTAKEEVYVRALLTQLRDPVAAVEQFRLYANLYPDAYSGQNNAGLLLWQELNRCDEALPLLDVVVNSRHPMRYASMHFLGYCQLALGNHSAAEQLFQAARAEKSPPITYGLIDVYSALGRFQDADAIIAEPPEPAPALFRLEKQARAASSMVARGDLAAAIAVLRTLQLDAGREGLTGTVARARLAEVALLFATGDKPAAMSVAQSLASSETAALTDTAPDQHDPARHLLLLALLVSRHDSLFEVRPWIEAARNVAALNEKSVMGQLLLLADIAAEAERTGPASLEAIPPLNTAGLVYQAAALRARLALRWGRPQEAREALQHMTKNAPQAYAEFNGIFAGQIINLLELAWAQQMLAQAETR